MARLACLMLLEREQDKASIMVDGGGGKLVQWHNVGVARTEHGKPYLYKITDTATNKGIKDERQSSLRRLPEFNISHHGDWVVVVAATTSTKNCNFSLGVDVSHVQPVPIVHEETTTSTKTAATKANQKANDFLACFQDHFTDVEWSYIRYAGETESLRRFAVMWTCKEAYIKALGRGLSMDLLSVEFVTKDPALLPPETVNTTIGGGVETVIGFTDDLFEVRLNGKELNGCTVQTAFLDENHPVTVVVVNKKDVEVEDEHHKDFPLFITPIQIINDEFILLNLSRFY